MMSLNISSIGFYAWKKKESHVPRKPKIFKAITFDELAGVLG